LAQWIGALGVGLGLGHLRHLWRLDDFEVIFDNVLSHVWNIRLGLE
jgi:hypothetical protein